MKLFLLICCSLVATVATADPAAWAFAGSGGGRVVLLGSVHYLRESDYPLPDSVQAYVGAADRILMEVDIDDIDPAALRLSFMRAAMLPPDLRLESVLSQDVYDRAVATARSMNVDLALMSRLEPWLVANTLLDVGMMQSGYSADRGLEQHLARMARERGIRIDGLETVDDQIGIFDSLALPAQEAMLAQTLDDIGTAGVSLGEMIDAWRAGDLESLADSLIQDFDVFPGLYERLVTDRNRSWVEELIRIGASGENVLVVVGALHLIGDDSVIAMLREAGQSVERIR